MSIDKMTPHPFSDTTRANLHSFCLNDAGATFLKRSRFAKKPVCVEIIKIETRTRSGLLTTLMNRFDWHSLTLSFLTQVLSKIVKMSQLCPNYKNII